MTDSHEKLDPKSQELACQIAMETAAEIVNEVCGSEGSRVVAVKEGGAKLSFAVPPETVDIAEENPELTREERISAIAESGWALGWAEGMTNLVAPELTGAEREKTVKRLAERVAAEIVSPD